MAGAALGPCPDWIAVRLAAAFRSRHGMLTGFLLREPVKSCERGSS